jgi:hypothetical protein
MVIDRLPINKRADGSFVLGERGNQYGVVFGDEDCAYPYSEVEAYLIEHPEALIPESTPPEPTPEQVAAIEAQRIEAEEAEKDRAFGRAFRKAIENNNPDPITTAKQSLDELISIKRIY